MRKKENFEFFISCPLGFEENVLNEIQQVSPYLLDLDGKLSQGPFLNPIVEKGGVTLFTELHLGFQLNFFLKQANRILLRQGQFKAYEFPVLDRKFSEQNWLEKLLIYNVNFVISAEKSKLNNEKRIQECLEKVLLKKQKSINKMGTIDVYVRVIEDEFTFSLDTSGDHLHRRGYSKLKGEAPLRETISSFILTELITNLTSAELKRINLIDPMMGSGTLLTEAISLWWPNFSRQFAFQSWKFCPALLKSELLSKNYKNLPDTVFGKITGFDMNPEMIEISHKNMMELKILTENKIAIKSWPVFNFETQNVIDDHEIQYDPRFKNWVISNPPYGERLNDKSQVLSNRIIDHLFEKFKADKVALLVPEVESTKIQNHHIVEKKIRINNGGIKTVLLIVKKSLTN